MITIGTVDTLFWFYAILCALLATTATFAGISGWITHSSQPSAMAITAFSTATICGSLAILQSSDATIPAHVLVAVYRGAWVTTAAGLMFSVGMYVDAHKQQTGWLRRLMFWWEPLVALFVRIKDKGA